MLVTSTHFVKHHLQMPPDLTSPVPALVGQYLQQIGSSVARPFILEFQPREVDFCLEEVVMSYREESRVVVDRQWDSLVNSLVYRHLRKVSPGLAEEFREQVQCSQTEHKLERFVKVLLKCMENEGSSKNRLDNDMKQKPIRKKNKVFVRRKFTTDEEAMIMASDGTNQSLTILARSFGRRETTFINRYARLCKVLPVKNNFTELDDQIILDAVLEQTAGKPLTEVSMHKKAWTEIAERLNRMWMAVYLRWKMTLLPWLLQHSAGALNLRIEVMLSNHLLASYSDIQKIDWAEVAKKTEFACHTVHSLKNGTFHNLRKNCARKLDIHHKEVTLSQVAEYS